MERPLFLPLLSTIIGLLTADQFLFFVPEAFPIILLAVSLPLIFVTNRLPFLLFVSFFFFCWANLSLKPYLIPQQPANDISRFVSDQKVTIEGVIDARPAAAEKGSRIYLRAERVYRDRCYTEVRGRILLYVGEGRGEFLTGDRVRFISRINIPRNFGLPGEFDYVRYLAYRQVHGTAYVPNERDIVLIRRKAGYPVQSMIDDVAGRLGRFIGGHAPGEEGCILRALLLGDAGGISKETKDAYARTGVNHILSISGFHVGIISLFVFYLLLLAARSSGFLMLHTNVRRLILVFTLPLILFYLFLSGAAPATIRSVIMIAAYILAMLLEREVNPLNSLMLAAVVILCCSPPALFDLSFQLSFVALWGIIVLVPALMAPFRGIEGTVRHKLLIFLMVSMAATLATMMPVAFYFHRVTLTGLIANFFIVPLMGYGAVLIGFSALPLVFCCPSLAGLLVKSAALLVKVSDEIILRLAALPELPFFDPGRFDMLLFFVFLAMITFVTGRKSKMLLSGGILALFVTVKLAGLLIGGNDDGLRITFFSVGQGESTLVSFPDGKKMLIDGGGSPKEGGLDVGERLLTPALRRMGVHRIDYLVLSHAHPDHLKGLIQIAKNLNVGEFWETGIHPGPDESFTELKRALAEGHIPVRLINASSRPVVIGKAVLEPLSPPSGNLPSENGTCPDENESSLVFRLRYGGFSILFTGDIGFDTERMLLAHPERLASTVLKVPHHGSRYSSSDAFVQAVSPRYALISAGYGNGFGLPSGRTLALLRRRGAEVYRTDLNGTVEVLENKDGCGISTFYPCGHFH